MKIGDRIRITRKINKITINDLANFLGISAPTLRKIESNELFINYDLIKRLLENPVFTKDHKEIEEYYYNQELSKKVLVQVKSERIYIIIPKDIAIGFNLNENNEIYCTYLTNKIILQHEENDDYIFEKRKIIKDRYSFIFFIGQKLKNLQGREVRLTLNLRKKILMITY
jgi:transcriptional regulator with XRE-family HTH domain